MGEILNQKHCPYEILEKEVKNWRGIDRLLSYRKFPLPNELAIEFVKNANESQLRTLIYGSNLLSKNYSKEFFYLLIIKADFLDYEDLARFYNNIIPLA
ncbi:hypothetical protein [Caminibacter sp.]